MKTFKFPRWRLRRRHLAPALAGVAGLLLLGGAARVALIRRMLLPRLVLNQGDNVTSVAITPNGKTVLGGIALDTSSPRWGGRSAFVSESDAASGQAIRRLVGLTWRAAGVTVSPDGEEVLATGDILPPPAHGWGDRVVAWDRRTGKMLWARPGGLPVCFSPDGRLVSASPIGATRGASPVLLDAATGRPLRRIAARIAEDGQTGFTPDGALFGGIVAADYAAEAVHDGERLYAPTRLHFWRTDTGQGVKDFPFTRVLAWDISRDGRWLVLVSDKGLMNGTDGSVVRRVDFRTGAVAWTRERSENGPDADPDAILNSVAVSPNGKSVVVAGPDCHLVVLDAATGRERFRPFVPHGRASSGWALPGGLAFSADGRTLVSRSGPDVLVWDAAALP